MSQYLTKHRADTGFGQPAETADPYTAYEPQPQVEHSQTRTLHNIQTPQPVAEPL